MFVPGSELLQNEDTRHLKTNVNTMILPSKDGPFSPLADPPTPVNGGFFNVRRHADDILPRSTKAYICGDYYCPNIRNKLNKVRVINLYWVDTYY